MKLSEEEVRYQYQHYKEERAQAEARRDAENHKMRAAEQVLGGLLALYPFLRDSKKAASREAEHESSAQEETPPKGIEALRLTMGQAPGTFFPSSQVVKDLLSRGWITDSNAARSNVRAGIGYAVQRGLVERGTLPNGQVVYAWKDKSPA
jgi:hypothetical protein